MILRLVKAMHFGVEKQARRLRSRRASRSRTGEPDSSSEDSWSDDNPQELAVLSQVTPPAVVNRGLAISDIYDPDFDEALAVR